MATTTRFTTWWCILLYLLALFATTTQSRIVPQDSLQAENITSTFLQVGVEKVGPPRSPFDNAAAKGCGLYTMMTLSPLLGSVYQSPFTDLNAAFDNGWVLKTRRDEPPNPVGQVIYSSDIDADVFEVFPDLGFSQDPDDNRWYKWFHGRQGPGAGSTQTQYGDGKQLGKIYPVGTRYGNTEGHYSNVINVKDGIIICDNNYSPEYMLKLWGPGSGSVMKSCTPPAPPMSRLSDVLWLQWQAGVSATGQPGLLRNIKMIWRHNVQDLRSGQIMDAIEAMPGHALTDWPGNTYSMTDADETRQQIAKALLGSPNGYAVAYMLAQHQAQLGRKTVSEVQYFSNGFLDRHLLFHIIDVPADPVVAGAAGPAK